MASRQQNRGIIPANDVVKVFVGSTRSASRLDAEDWRCLVNAYLEGVSASLSEFIAYGGGKSCAFCRPGLRSEQRMIAGTFLVDYRPVQRVDLYAGVALSNVYRGLANGFLQTQNIDPTVSLRIKF